MDEEVTIDSAPSEDIHYEMRGDSVGSESDHEKDELDQMKLRQIRDLLFKGDSIESLQPKPDPYSKGSETLPEKFMRQHGAKALMVPSFLIPSFINAKGFLMKSSTENGDQSIYNHLLEVLRKLLSDKPEDPLNMFEKVSRHIKHERSRINLREFQNIPEECSDLEAAITCWEFFKRTFGYETLGREVDTKIEDEPIYGLDAEGDSADDSEKKIDACIITPDLPLVLECVEHVGFGMRKEEIIRIFVAMHNLASSKPLSRVRFWGKIMCLTKDYYIVEASYKIGEEEKVIDKPYSDTVSSMMQEMYDDDFEKEYAKATGVKSHLSFVSDETLDLDKVDFVAEEESSIEPSYSAESLSKYTMFNESGINEMGAVKQPRSIISAPKGTTDGGSRRLLCEAETEQGVFDRQYLTMNETHNPDLIPEDSGTGVNMFCYFATSDFGKSWKRLPHIAPKHIQEAKLFKKVFSGNFDSEFKEHSAFPWNEGTLLRAQVARITASTSISPVGYYSYESNQKQEEETLVEDEEIEKSSSEEAQSEERVKKSVPKIAILDESITENKDFNCPTVDDLRNSDQWVHDRDFILSDGRCHQAEVKSKASIKESSQKMSAKSLQSSNPQGDVVISSNNVEPDEEASVVKSKPSSTNVSEDAPFLLTPISQDMKIYDQELWETFQTSDFFPDRQFVGVKSVNWPGAYAFSDGKGYFNIYLGHGLKRLNDYISILMPEFPQNETDENPTEMDEVSLTEKESESFLKFEIEGE